MGDFRSLARNTAFPQYYNNDDRFSPHTPSTWHRAFWLHMVVESNGWFHNNYDPMLIMGGEL